MVEQVEKSPQSRSESSKDKSPMQVQRKDIQMKAPLYSSPAVQLETVSTKKGKKEQTSSGILRPFTTSNHASEGALEKLLNQRQEHFFSKMMQEEDSILLRSSRSDLQSSSDKQIAKHELPMQITDRTLNSIGTTEELAVLQRPSDNLRASEPRLSDPDDLRSSTGALKHLFSIKPLSGAKPLNLNSSFSSNSGLQFHQNKFNQTSILQTKAVQSARAMSSEVLNRVPDVVEQMQNDFQKQLRKKENDWSTKEALLTQKIEFLEAELREVKEREAKSKAMHAQMIEALNAQQPVQPVIQAAPQDSASHIQLLELEQMYQNQLEQSRQETFELGREYKQKLQTKDTQIKELQIKIETLQIDHQRKIQELALDKKSLENQLKRISSEKTQLEAQVELAESMDQQLAQLKQQTELLEKEKSLQAEKLRIQIREHNEQIIKLERQMQEKTTERVRQVELESRDRERLLQEKLEQQMKQLNDDNIRHIEQMHEEQEQLKLGLESQLQQAIRQAEIERSMIQPSGQSLLTTQLCIGVQHTNFGNLLEHDASSIQGSERVMTYEDGFPSQEKCDSSQIEEVAGLKSQVDKLKRKLQAARQANNELIEKEKALHKKHKQQIEHVLMSIFLSDRYIKDGVSVEEIEQKSQVREIYQKKINDEIEARLNAETELQEMRHLMQKVKVQAQESIAEKESLLKLQSVELAKLQGELESLNKEQRTRQNETAEQIFTPQRSSSKKIVKLNLSVQLNQNRPPSQNAKPKSSEPQAPQLLQKTTQNEQVSTLQLKLLKSCQMMVDSASRMECSQCHQLYSTTEFYEHITTEAGSFQCLSHVKLMTNLSHQVPNRQQNRSFHNVSSSQNVMNFKKHLHLIKPRESSAGNLSQFRKANNSSSLFFHNKRSSMGASIAASSTSIVQSGVPLPLMFHRTSQTSGPLFQHVSVGMQNITQALDATLEESSILQQAPTLNSTTYQQFTQHLNAIQDAQGVSQLRSQSALQSSGHALKQAAMKLTTQAQKMTRNSKVKGSLQVARSVEHGKPEISKRPYPKPIQTSQVIMPLQIKQKSQNQLQSFFSHQHHQTQVNWSQKSLNQLSHQAVKREERPPHPITRHKAEEKHADLSSRKRVDGAKFSPAQPADRPSKMTRHTRGSSLKTSHNPELAINHIASIQENQLISVSQDMYQPEKIPQLTSQYFEGIAADLAENIGQGQLKDDQESLRTGSSLESEAENVQDQIGNGFFKLNYPQGDDKGTSFKRKQDALISGQLAASNYFRDDSATDALPHEQEVDSASDWYGSVSNQQNQEMLIAEKQKQMRADLEKVQGGGKAGGIPTAQPQKTKVVPRLNLQGQQQSVTQKPSARHEETKRANYATQILPSANQKPNKTAREVAKNVEETKKIDKSNFGQTVPTSLLKLEIDHFDQSVNAQQYKLDSFRAYGKPFCTSTKGGQRYDKNNLLVSQSMNNLDQVLDTQTDSRPSMPVQEQQQPFNKLNLDKVTKAVHDNSSASQLNAPRAGRLPTASDYQADSVNYMRTELSDSLAPDDESKEESQAQGKQSAVKKPTKTVGIRDLNILMNMVQKPEKPKAAPLPKNRQKGRLNEGSHAVEYFFNETEPDKPSGKRNVAQKKSPFRKEQASQKSRFKTESHEESPQIDSCEEDQDIRLDECDIDSNDLQEDKLHQVVLHTEMHPDNDTFKEEDNLGAFGLFVCTALKDKGAELKSYFRPIQQPKVLNGLTKRKRGDQKTFKPSLMANQESKFTSKSFLGFKLV